MELRRVPIAHRTRAASRGLVAVALAAVLASVAAARAVAAPASGEAEARAALDRAKGPAKSKVAAERARSAEALAGHDHPSVARELLARLRRETEPVVARAILRALGGQAASKADVTSRVSTWLRAEADADRRREKAGDPGFPIDPKTGEPALATDEGRLALERGAARAAARVEALAALGRLGADVSGEVAAWTPFLQDPSDDLVVATLHALANARCGEALPDVLDLFRMYPAAARWETGAVVDLSGTHASAKRTWMVRFGHPAKQQARPKVFAAMTQAIEAITGRRFDDTDALAAWIEARPRAQASKGARR